jgi:hypothetical protein
LLGQGLTAKRIKQKARVRFLVLAFVNKRFFDQVHRYIWYPVRRGLGIGDHIRVELTRKKLGEE